MRDADLVEIIEIADSHRVSAGGPAHPAVGAAGGTVGESAGVAEDQHGVTFNPGGDGVPIYRRAGTKEEDDRPAAYSHVGGRNFKGGIDVVEVVDDLLGDA